MRAISEIDAFFTHELSARLPLFCRVSAAPGVVGAGRHPPVLALSRRLRLHALSDVALVLDLLAEARDYPPAVAAMEARSATYAVGCLVAIGEALDEGRITLDALVTCASGGRGALLAALTEARNAPDAAALHDAPRL